jgi:hypothetical protein
MVNSSMIIQNEELKKAVEEVQDAFNAFQKILDKYPGVFEITLKHNGTYTIGFDMDALEQCLSDQKKIVA